MENKGYENIVGNANAPYINSLIAAYGLDAATTASLIPLTELFGAVQRLDARHRRHANHNFAGRNLADQLETVGKTWKVFAQNVPPDCFAGATAAAARTALARMLASTSRPSALTDISTSPARCVTSPISRISIRRC